MSGKKLMDGRQTSSSPTPSFPRWSSTSVSFTHDTRVVGREERELSLNNCVCVGNSVVRFGVSGTMLNDKSLSDEEVGSFDVEFIVFIPPVLSNELDKRLPVKMFDYD